MGSWPPDPLAMERIIGVTGHRFLAQLDRVRAGVDRALDRIDETFPAETTTVISMLAEGADQLVAECVLGRRGSRLVALLPLPQPDYLAGFSDDEGQRAFLRLLDRADQIIELPPTASADEAYLAAGHWLVDNCQVLVAVWDGRPAQGAGGTADIVQRARDRELPLAWVRAGNRRPGTRQAIGLGALQGTVSLERFSGPASRVGRGERRTSNL
jgi:hypothetical protein